MPETIYQKMIELTQPRNFVMMALFAGALGFMLIQYAIETSSIPAVKNHVSFFRSTCWTCILIAYLTFAAYLFVLFTPWSLP